MKKTLAVAALALCASVFAQTAPAPAAVPADASLYQAFGEGPGLARLTDDFMARLLADPRTGPHFKQANTQRVKEQLAQQFCQVTGGPCVYKGADMKSAHANLDITKRDYNALVEVLQQAMDAQGVPFRAQNGLLAKLAFMYRDIITVN